MEAKTAMPGGEYLATQNPDGSWNIHGIPFLPAHEVPVRDQDGNAVRDEEGNALLYQVDAEWLSSAMYAAKRRFELDSYLPPLHIEHKGQVPRTELGGRYKLRSVDIGTYEGEQVSMLYGDLTYIPANVYEEIRAGRLPYLSPEIHNLNIPEIDSVALMDDTVPHFRLPMITIGEERPYKAEPSQAQLAATGPVISYSARSGRSAILQAETGDPVMENDHGSDGLDHLVKQFTAGLRAYFNGGEGGMEDVIPDAAEGVAIEVEADEVDPAPAEQMMEGEDHQIPDGETLMDEPPEKEDTDDDKAGATYEAARAGAKRAVKYSALQRQVAKQGATLDAMKRTSRIEARVQGAMKTLKQFGMEGEEVLAEVQKYAAQGQSVLKCYVDTIKGHKDQLPPSIWDGEQVYAGAPVKGREFVADLPIEDQGRAAQLCAEYEGSGFQYSATKEQFVKRSLASSNGVLNPTKGGK